MKSATRKEIERACAEAVRTANRGSALGALGFGLALIMGAILAQEGSLLARGFGLEVLLLVGGVIGGLTYTAMAVRASRMARRCQRLLDGR